MRTLAAALLLLAAINGGAMSDVPSAVPQYVDPAPKLDGDLSDPAWQQAGHISNFQLLGDAGPARQRTEVRLCYTKSAIYIAFECFEDRMDRIVTANTEDQAPVWTDDSVEIFVAPYSVADAGKTHHFAVNAEGAKTHIQDDYTPRDTHWRAVTKKLADRWIAEIEIPYSVLGTLGSNERCWRANFCRQERPHSEVSSWSSVQEFFATYSRFGKLLPSDAPFHFVKHRGTPIALQPQESAPAGPQPLDARSSEVHVPGYIVPEPQELREKPGEKPFRINSDTKIVIDDDTAESDTWTVEEINKAIEQLGGKPLPVVHSKALSDAPESAENAIVVGESARNRLVQSLSARNKLQQPKSPAGTGTYVLDVSPNTILIWGSLQTDTYYGAQTLKQLLRPNPDGTITVRSLTVRDYPRFPFRGVHLLSSADALTYIGKLIDNVLAPLKVNHIVLQTDKIAWASHPEITDKSNFMPREDVKKLIEIARRHHITVTPLVQSPGHLEWAFLGGHNLDIAEDPKHPYCYCMTNPKSYEFIFSIMDDAIDLFGHPEYFHAGRDEFDMEGEMPHDQRCKAIGKEKLYAEDTIKIYEHLKSKGCKMMMWGDVLDKPVFKDHIDEIPKDILINDWRYAPSETYPSIDFYQAHGFPVVGGTWYNTANISTFSTYAAKRNIDGMLQTTWCGWALEPDILKNYAEQVYAYVLSAAWAWNPDRPAIEEMPYRPDAVFNKLWYENNRTAQPDFVPIRIDRFCNISRSDSDKRIGWLGNGPGNDLSAIPAGLIELEGTPFMILAGDAISPAAILLGGGVMPEFPRQVQGISVNAKLTALSFLHGCAHGADKGAKVGSYVVHYEDGKTETIELIYSANTSAWDDGSKALTFAWRTKANDGRIIGVSDLHWKNPRPDMKITTIDFVSADTEASPFLLALTAEQERHE